MLLLQKQNNVIKNYAKNKFVFFFKLFAVYLFVSYYFYKIDGLLKRDLKIEAEQNRKVYIIISTQSLSSCNSPVTDYFALFTYIVKKAS